MSNQHDTRRSEFVRTVGILRHPKIYEPLPPVYRWEFTRRHPYYLRFWKWANRYHQMRREEFDASQLDFFDRHDLFGSMLLLGLIGVFFDEHPDPAIDARKNKDFKPPFSAVVAKPTTHRQLALLLLTFLPDDVQSAVAYTYLRELAKETASDDGKMLLHAVVGTITNKEQAVLEVALNLLKGDEPLADRLIHCLNRLDAASLDDECPGIMWVNYNAPLDDLKMQMAAVVKKWRSNEGVSDSRRRADKWDEYLAVWDAREGWHDGAYDGTRRKRLRDIAVETRTDLATVQSRYKTAYKLIVGKDYDPVVWSVLFGGLRVPKGKWDSWRKTKQSTTDDALSKRSPESALEKERFTPQSSASALMMTDDDLRGYRELLSDLKTLIAKGRPNEEIIVELELAIQPEDLEEFHQRLCELV